MKKKLVVMISVALVASALLLFSSTKQEYIAVLELSQVEQLAFAESCMNGGVGSSGCSHSGTIGLIGSDISYSCGVDCQSGYYACCSITCFCVSIGQ